MKSNSAPLAQEFNPEHVNLGDSLMITGGDAYLTDQVLDGLRKRMSSAFGADIVILYGDEIKTADLNDHLDTLSIFSGAKLLIIRNADKLERKQLEAVAEYFEAPSEIQSLAIVVDKADMRLSAWKAIQKGCIVVPCDPPRLIGNMRTWLDRALKSTGKGMTSKAKEIFTNRIELDYAYAASELAKLDILTGERREIREEDVVRSLGTTRAGTLIDFFQALGRKSPGLAMDAMDKMLGADWEPLQVFFQIQKFYILIWRILSLRRMHISENEIMNKRMSDIFQSQRKEYLEMSRSYSLSNIEKILALLLETDAQLKSSNTEPQLVLSNCLLQALCD